MSLSWLGPNNAFKLTPLRSAKYMVQLAMCLVTTRRDLS